MDEFRVEVTPLGGRLPPADDLQDGAASDIHRVPTSTASTSVSDIPLRQRDGRTRVLRASAVTMTILLTLVALLLFPAGTRSAVFQLLAGPTTTPTTGLLPGSDFFLWEHAVPWGALLIDGRQGPDIRGPSVTFDQQGQRQILGFHLPRGTHTLDYRAALFPTLHCTVSVPRAATDTCPLDLQNTGFFILEKPGIRVLDLQATVDRLPPDQTRALAALTQTVLDAIASAAGQDTIARGDHLLAADGRRALVTDTPLTAQARLTLTDSIALDRPAEVAHCKLLCSSDELLAQQSSPEIWTLYAPVELSWRYLGADGRVVLDDGPALPVESRVGVIVTLAVRWEQHVWQVHIAPAGPGGRDTVICAVGRHALDVLGISPGQTVVDVHLQWPYTAPAPGLGCLFSVSNAVDTPGTPTGMAALVLYRCGVLLAVNSEAQHIFPHLPHASVHEQAIARAVTPAGVTASP